MNQRVVLILLCTTTGVSPPCGSTCPVRVSGALPEQEEGHLASHADNVCYNHRFILFGLAFTPLLWKARFCSSLCLSRATLRPEKPRAQTCLDEPRAGLSGTVTPSAHPVGHASAPLGGHERKPGVERKQLRPALQLEKHHIHCSPTPRLSVA